MADSGVEANNSTEQYLNKIHTISSGGKDKKPGCAFEVGEEVGCSGKKVNVIRPIEESFCEDIEGSVIEYFRSKNVFGDNAAYIVCFIKMGSHSSSDSTVATPKLVQINWTSDNCGVKKKMLASSSTPGFKRALRKATLENPLLVTVNDEGSLNPDQLVGDSAFKKYTGGPEVEFDESKFTKKGAKYLAKTDS